MRWRDLLINNLGWKLLSLILATLIWATYSSDLMERLRPGSLRRFSSVPVTVLTTATDGRAYRVSPEKIEIVLRGLASSLEVLQLAEVRAYVDLTSVRDTEGLRQKIEVNTPPGFTVARVVPADAYVEPAPVAPPVNVLSPTTP
jgi:hypothetical protein